MNKRIERKQPEEKLVNINEKIEGGKMLRLEDSWRCNQGKMPHQIFRSCAASDCRGRFNSPLFTAMLVQK